MISGDFKILPGGFLFFCRNIKFKSLIFFLFFINLFVYFWLCWVFVAAHGPSLVAETGDHSSLWCTASHCCGFSCCRAVALGARASVVVARGLQSAGSAVAAHKPSCSTACGIPPDQGSNPRPLHCQADSQPLCHQGSPSSSH